MLSGPGYGFSRPFALALDGTDLFVANQAIGAPGSVTEVDASTGAPLRVLSGSQYRFNEPQALTLDGAELFVANFADGSVTELNTATGALTKVLSGPAYRFDGPDAMTVGGPDLFVANGEGSLTELPRRRHRKPCASGVRSGVPVRPKRRCAGERP